MTRKTAASGPVTARPMHWVYVTIMVLLIGPFSLAVVYSDELYKGYVRAYVAPATRRQFGFGMGRRRMYYRTQALDVYVFEGLEPGGVMARAGARDCDVPVGAYHMSDVELYRKLRDGSKRAVEIQMVNCAEYEEMLRAGDLDLFERGRKIVVTISE